MKYTIHRLDGRHTYHNLFQYYVGFGRIQLGPAYFNRSLKWFINTYGFSAEAGHYREIKRYFDTKCQLGMLSRTDIEQSVDYQLCNPLWSWTLGYNDMRIYLAREQELAFFQLSHPVDQ